MSKIGLPSKRRKLHWDFDVTAWFVLDAILAFCLMNLCYFMSPSFDPKVERSAPAHLGPQQAALLFSVIFTACAHIFRLHDPLLPRLFWPTLNRCIGASFLANGILAVIVFTILYSRIGRLILIQALIYPPIVTAMARRLVWKKREQRRRRILLVGKGNAVQLVKWCVSRSGLPFELLDLPYEGNGSELRHALGVRTTLSEECSRLGIDEVITCISEQVADSTLHQLMDCINSGVTVCHFTSFIERNFLHVAVEGIRSEWFLTSDLEVNRPLYQGVKRLVDVVASLIGILLSTPIVLIASGMIRLESRGSVFYSQVRVGKYNQCFRIWKLRTMKGDAEKDGPKWAAEYDNRVTRVGRLLRKTRIDEVPQFWNILRGEMSLVGPRPERPEFVEKLEKTIPFFQQRHLVKPGLTGWAQINYPYGASPEDALNKLKYDLYYVKYCSIGLDLQIILRTIGAVMKGAR